MIVITFEEGTPGNLIFKTISTGDLSISRLLSFKGLGDYKYSLASH